MNDLNRTNPSNSLITPNDYNGLVARGISNLSNMPAKTQMGYHLSQDVQVKSRGFVGVSYKQFSLGVSRDSQNVHQELTVTITKMD